ncbi:MAG: MotA/TolQ/ExbB proton channel family protein [Treponema sp.]|nr:MotA/TolQ/ExbB proton channel family protein [Treponema sp.]
MIDSFFGFQKGLTLEQLTSLEGFKILDQKIENNEIIIDAEKLDGEDNISKFSFFFNDSYSIESIEVMSFPIEEDAVKESFLIFRNSLKNEYGEGNTIPEDYIQLTEKEVQHQAEQGHVYCLWNKDNNKDFTDNLDYVYLDIEKKEEDFVLTVKCKFSDYETKDSTNTEEENEGTIDSDLLDGEDEETVYDNETSYEESKEKNEEFVEENEINDPDNEQEKGINKKEFPLSIINIICFIFIIIIWLGFLWNPFKQICLDKSKNSWINILYYVIYFSYTVFACWLPSYIKRKLNQFTSSVDKERKALETGKKYVSEGHGIWEAYKSTFFEENFGIKNKTRANADLYFNYEAVANTMMPNFPVTKTFKIIASSFTGLGILGTFLGFAIGFGSIDDFSNTSTLAKQIEGFIESGLGTAFNTSIVGVLCSLIYNFLIYNPLIQKVNKYFEKLSDSLDKEFYVSETEALMQYTMLTDENAQSIPFSQSLRFIIENMNKQTDALNNFNDNLADKIANMNETVNTTLGKIVTGVGTEVKDAVLENVHQEMDTLKLSLADAAKQMSLVAEKIANTPELLGKANEELKSYLDDTRTSFTDMLAQNLESHKAVLGEMVSTIKEELTNRFKELGSSITKALTSTQKAAQLLDNVPDKIENVENKFEVAADKLQEVSDSVNGYLESVERGITGILQDLNSAEENVKELLASAKINEDNSGKNLNAVIDETNRMLEGFKAVDINLKNIFESIGNEIVKYNTTVDATLKQYLSSFEDGSKAFSSSIHGSIQEFEDTLNELSTNIADVQQTSKAFDDSIDKLGKIIAQNKTEKK